MTVKKVFQDHSFLKSSKKKSVHLCHANLKYEWWCGLEFQYSRGTQWFKHRIRVVAEGLVDHHQSIDIVHVETNFIWTCATLRKSQLWICYRGRQAHHDRVVVHRTVLTGNRNEKRHKDLFSLLHVVYLYLLSGHCFNIRKTGAIMFFFF